VTWILLAVFSQVYRENWEHRKFCQKRSPFKGVDKEGTVVKEINGIKKKSRTIGNIP
jgi:hypothetical protein